MFSEGESDDQSNVSICISGDICQFNMDAAQGELIVPNDNRKGKARKTKRCTLGTKIYNPPSIFFVICHQTNVEVFVLRDQVHLRD